MRSASKVADPAVEPLGCGSLQDQSGREGKRAHLASISAGSPAFAHSCDSGSVLASVPSQMLRSSAASRGLALACTPLSEPDGSAAKPRDFHCLKILLRSELGAAVEQSVAPITSSRN
jgi:hypothetical protein